MLQGSNKARIARRVIEVLEFFDDRHGEATVMDIVRRYDRPQSSTSELLSSLVELGILYKDPQNRSYRPTPRAAMLGASNQAPIVRDGRLTELMDRLRAQTGLAVALFGMVGVDAQIFDTRSTRDRTQDRITQRTYNGRRERLTHSAVGRLLLSTLSRTRREGIVRRLNADVPGEHMPLADMLALIDTCERQGTTVGEAGFGCGQPRLRRRVKQIIFPAGKNENNSAIRFECQRFSSSNLFWAVSNSPVARRALSNGQSQARICWRWSL